MSDFKIHGYAEPTFGAQVRLPAQGLTLTTHPESACIDRAPHPCIVHRPSDHHMRDWPINYRADKGVSERICPHGVGHDDPDDVDYQLYNFRKSGGDPKHEKYIGSHGCDGCCLPPD